MAEIQVPVKLLILNLQSLVTELQNKLSNLKVGSTGFKNILNIIQSIRGEIDKLSVLTAKPFVDASLFTKAERSVDKLEDLITKVSIAISRLKFGDLELTDAQKADIKGFEDSINNIKDKIKTVKDAAKEAFLKTEVGLEWLSINPEAATKSLSQITGAIEREVDKLRQELEKLKASAADYLKAIDLNNRVREFLDKSGDDPLSKLNLGELYDKIFLTTAKNLLRYTPSGRNLLADWLSSLLKLDDSTISQIVNKNITAANVTGKLKEVLSSLLAADKELHTKLDANNVALQEKLALYNLLAVTLNTAAAAQLGITVAEQAARAELANTEAAAASYKDRLVDIARSGADVQATTNAMKSQLEGFRTTLELASGSFLRLLRTQLSFNQMKMAVVNFMGFNQVLNLTKRAVREAVNHIKELDTVMNKISIVTDMSTGDLWGQVDQYSKMAQAFGTTIKGAYEVSQIYYQQGLETNDVLTLTNETLKLAKVSGLDYATTTDYMTTALRGFKMEMSEASTVVDVYSNLAAHTAVSSEELAVAMSKTASSMESVGSTFEETSAMIGTMVAVTRESAVNIGSALKSIAARYGEMKKDPLSIIDSEGEEVSFNKVDAALQSVGISLKTTDGLFRSFTDVIIELSEKWDQLESTQQRYIATLFAGNRQQSRFLALVSNKDLLKANIGFAEESEDTGTLQALKALDSIESKLNLVQVAYQQFYTTMGIETAWKGFLDGAKNVINTLNSFPKLFGKLPVGALAAITTVVSLIKTMGVKIITEVALIMGNGLMSTIGTTAELGGKSFILRLADSLRSGKSEVLSAAAEVSRAAGQGVELGLLQVDFKKFTSSLRKDRIKSNNLTIDSLNATLTNTKAAANMYIAGGRMTPQEAFLMLNRRYDAALQDLYNKNAIPTEVLDKYTAGQISAEQAVVLTVAALEQENVALNTTGTKFTSSINSLKAFGTAHKQGLLGLASFGLGLSMVGMMMDTTTKNGKSLSAMFMGIGGAISSVSNIIANIGNGLKAIPWMAVLSGAMMVVNAISTLIVTPEERLQELEKKAEELSNKAKEEKANFRTLETAKNKLDELEKKRYDSAEAAEEYLSAVDDLTSKFPELISRFDEAGNAIIEAGDMERVLSDARAKTAAATYEAAAAEKEKAELELKNKISSTTNLVKLTKSAYTSDVKPEIEKEIANNVLDILDKDSALSILFNGSSIGGQFLDRLVDDLGQRKSTSATISSDLYNLIIAKGEGSPIHSGMRHAQAVAVDQLLSIASSYISGTDVELKPLYNELKSIEAPSVEITNFIKVLETLPEFNTIINDALNSSSNEIEELFDEMTSDLDNGDFISAEEEYELLRTIINNYKKEGILTEYIKSFEEGLNKVGNSLKELKLLALIDQNAAKSLITGYIANLYDKSGFVLDNSGLSGFIANNFTDIWHEEELDLSWDAFLSKYLQDILEMADQVDSFWNILSLEGNDTVLLLTQMLSNTDIYSLTDLTTKFGYLEGWDDIYSIIEKDYNRRVENILETILAKEQAVIDNFQELGIDYKELDLSEWNEAASTAETLSQLRMYTNVLNGYQNLMQKGYVESASQYLTDSITFINELTQLDIAYRTTVEEYLKQYDITTRAGIQGLIDKLTKDDIAENDNLIPLLEKLLLTTNDNISLAFLTAISDFTEAWEKKAKTLDKLTKGLDISDVASVINEASAIDFTLTTDDFIMSGDKLVLLADKAAEYYEAVYEAEKANVLLYTTSFNEAAEALGTVSENGDFSVNKLSGYFNESGKKQLETLGLNTEKYLDNLGNGAWQLKSDISLEDLYAAIEEAYKNTNKNIDDYYIYIKWAYEAIKKDLQWSLGNYSGLSSITSLSITDLMLKTDRDLAYFKDQPDIKKAVDKARGATENLLNDIVTKGLNLDLSDYEGLPAEIKTEFYHTTNKNKYKFIRKYASYLGKTIEETNDFLIQVRQSEDESKVAAKEALKDITFYSKDQAYASLDSIKKIADILNISVDDIIGQYNELLGGYQVNLDNIDLSSIDGFAEMVKESIDGIIKNIVGFASSAISGKLSQQDKLNFNAQLEALSLSAISDIDFVETVDGLKMSQAAAINLYNELKKVDSILAKLVFDDLNKSLQESNEHYKNISDIANRIKEIESIAPDARSKEYELELALAKLIYAVRSTTEDSSFNFMSNKIPGAQNNPINYFNNWAKAIHTFNDALKTQGTYTRGGKTVKSGFVDYDFWYNLVTEMNNIARVSGTEIEFAGKTLNGKLQTAAELIEMGASSLVATDTGEIKVALSGMLLDFKTGADAFSGGVTEGIKALAKSQSDMLDGMIKLLETVVAMEELGDIDAGKDGKIDLGDLFPEFTIEGMKLKLKPEILDNFDAFVKEAGNSLNDIIIGTESLASMIDRAKNEGLTQLEALNFTNIMNSLYSLYKSGEYSLDNIYDSILSILASSGFEGTIQVGDRQLIIQNGTTIIETEDGGYEDADGTKYGTLNDAILGQLKKAIEKMAKLSDGAIILKDNVVTLKIDGKAITLTFDKDGNLTDTNGKSYSSLNAYFKEQIDSDERYDTIEEYKIDKKLKVVPVIEGGGELPPETIAQMKAAGITSAELLLAIWNEYSNDLKYKFKAKYGVELVGEELTQEQLADINKLLADETKNININVDDNGTIKAIEDSIKEIKGKTVYIDVVERTSTTETTPNKTKPGKFTPTAYEPAGGAAGNLGFANAKGTLMGELGPELVVSKGRYFVVGQAGPEMVNLADDAIVFNHLQTESLLKKGMSKGRGKVVTNERNAVSFATGNINGGPAKVSASAELAALRQLKAQWDALAGLSAKDLAGKGGGGGGGGGDPKAFVKDLERWYDWLQQIAQLEKEITLEEAKRAKYQSDMVARGKEYFTSQMASLEKLQEQAVVLQSLNDSLEEYFLKRLKELNEQSAFSALYGFSESGQLYYKDVYADGKGAFEWLSDLVGRDEVTGQANYTAEEQYNKLVEAGFGFAMQYDSAGNEIKHEGEDWYNTALQAFWDKIDRDKEEMQSLHDSVEDGKKKLYELENAQNEILHEIEDNQIEVEQKVLKAIEEARQREIDELKDTKEAIENSAKEFTDGLNKQLDKERQMRDNQANADELASLLRRLSILQRSGGSASEIRDLLQLINDKQYDKYFDMQEQLIQAIQDSSDAQIERLDNQILLMEETLAYEKENGLLWVDVDDILKQSSEDIVSFILGNTSEYWSKSTTELLKVLREDLFEVDRFKQFLETVEEGMDTLIELYGTEELKKALADKKRAETAVKDAAANATNPTNTTNTKTTSDSSSQEQKQEKYKATFTNHAGGRTDAYSVTSKEDAIKKALDYIRNSYAELQKKHSGMPQAGLGDAMRADLASIKAILYYSTGGYDYTTGLAMLHGTKTRPEGIFNAEQTRILREQFLSNRPDSVISLLKDYRDAYHGLSSNTYDSIQNNSNAMTIEHAEVNLNVDKLADDYDAKRAANTVMDEMLRIASKTKSNNSVRR